MKRAHLLLVGLAAIAPLAVASCSSCAGAGAAKEDIALAPKESNVVVSFNVKRMRDTAMWRKLLDARDQAPADSRKKYDDFVTRTGLDPTKQIDSLFIAFPPPPVEAEFGAVVRGTFDEQKLVAYATEEAKREGHTFEPSDYNGKKIYTQKEQSEVAVAFLDAHTIVFGGKDWTRKMIDRAVGKSPSGEKLDTAKDNEALMALVKKARTTDAVWGAGTVPESIRPRLADMPLAQAKSMKAAYGSIDFASGLGLDAVIQLGSPEDAKGLAEEAQKQLAQLKQSPQVMMMGLASMVDAVKVSSEASDFRVKVAMTQPQVDQLSERLQGMLKSLGGGVAAPPGGEPTPSLPEGAPPSGAPPSPAPAAPPPPPPTPAAPPK